MDNHATHYQRRRLAKTLIQLQLSKNKLEQMERSLISRGVVNADLQAIYQQVRQHWRVWPSAVAPLLAEKMGVDAKNLENILQSYIDVYLTETEEEVLTV